MSEEYIDGIDNGGSLKYEKTQNRDIIHTIERINRSEKFRGSSDKIIKIISEILKGKTEKLINEIWRNKHDSHMNPSCVSISVDIVPPVLKKVHPDGDMDTYFKPHKEYPFYYLLNLKVSMKFLPNANDIMANDEAWYNKWFINNIVPKYSVNILTLIKEELDKHFSNVFAFPTLNKKEDENDNQVTIQCTNDKELGRINIVVTPVLKFNRTNEESGIHSRFDSTEEMKEIMVSSVSMALERIIRV